MYVAMRSRVKVPYLAIAQLPPHRKFLARLSLADVAQAFDGALVFFDRLLPTFAPTAGAACLTPRLVGVIDEEEPVVLAQLGVVFTLYQLGRDFEVGHDVPPVCASLQFEVLGIRIWVRHRAVQQGDGGVGVHQRQLFATMV
jgi:hypothetical protein